MYIITWKQNIQLHSTKICTYTSVTATALTEHFQAHTDPLAYV